MIPIGDSPRRRTTPYINWLIIILNVLVFFYELSLPSRQLEQFFFAWGLVPVDFVRVMQHFSLSNMDALYPLVTSQFIHGGWLHIIGNMIFLWVFGDNVEDTVGHVRYIVFYLISGVLAGLTHIAFNVTSNVP